MAIRRWMNSIGSSRPARSIGTIAVLAVLLLGCTDGTPSVEDLDPVTLFATDLSEEELVEQVGPCSEQAVSVYLQARNLWNSEFLEEMSLLDPDSQVAVRVSFTQPLPWETAAPSKDALTIVGAVTTSSPEGLLTVFEVTSFHDEFTPQQQLVSLLGDDADDWRAQYGVVQARVQAALDVGNANRAAERTARLKEIESPKLHAEEAVANAQEHGPPLLALGLSGTVDDIARYLSEIGDDQVYATKIVVSNATGPIVSTEPHGGGESPLARIRASFGSSVMLEMPTQYEVARRTHGCPVE